MLCFIDFCIALCNRSNARIRYDVACRYSNGLQYNILFEQVHSTGVYSSSLMETILKEAEKERLIE